MPRLLSEFKIILSCKTLSQTEKLGLVAAQRVKSLLCRCEDPSMYPQHLVKTICGGL